MITVTDLAKSFAGRTLFCDVSLQINRGDRMALVGPNGAGKSTLFSIVMGMLPPDEGNILRDKTMSIGFLPQETAPASEETVLEIATTLTPEVSELRQIIRAHEAGESSDAEALHLAEARLAELGVRQAEPEAKRILAGLAFRESDFHRPARELSGGWCMRAHLARLLVMQPDLLMLDEPTNHLDLESVLWFQNTLKLFRGALLVISHDREFINAVTEEILELRHERMHRYRGSFEDYLLEREARDARHQAAYDNQQRHIETVMANVNRFRAKARRASQAQSKLKQLDRLERIAAPTSEAATVQFRFPQPERAGQYPVRLENVGFAYGDLRIYEGLNFECSRGDRIVLVGPNGAGKSTLLKLVAGMLQPQSGTVTYGHRVSTGYYAQSRTEMLNPHHTVLQEALAVEHRPAEETVRGILGSFLFRGDDVFKPVPVLSGGEKSRLALAKQILDPPNLLLMDEPTTHLDFASTETLIAALRQFEGTLIFISHDVYFIRSLATRVLHISAGKITPYAGGYDYYLEKSRQTNARAALTSEGGLSDERPPESAAPVVVSGTSIFKSKEQKRREAEERQARARERKVLEAEVARIESEIHALEQRQKELTVLLESPETYQPGGGAVLFNQELLAVTHSLERHNAQWAEAAEQLAALV
jgi:ATP-binding cassette subfamily F protein 3